MKFECTANYPADECQQLVLFASRGIVKKGIDVSLVPSRKSFSGRAYRDGRIRLRMGPKNTLRPFSPTTKELRQILRHVPCRDWRDVLVFLAAHEFKHIAQFRKGALECPGCAEQEAEAHAIIRLNAWRVETGRPPISLPE